MVNEIVALFFHPGERQSALLGIRPDIEMKMERDRKTAAVRSRGSGRRGISDRRLGRRNAIEKKVHHLAHGHFVAERGSLFEFPNAFPGMGGKGSERDESFDEALCLLEKKEVPADLLQDLGVGGLLLD